MMRPPFRPSQWLWVLVLMAGVVGALFYALQKALLIPTFHLDGAYQTASGLYRLADGELPGRDFLPYLGLGPIYLLLPAFLAAGQNVSGATFSAFYMVAVIAAMKFAVLFYVIVLPRRWMTALGAGAIFALLLIALESTTSPLGTALLYPGNSLRPVRSFAPFLGVLAAYAVVRRSGTPFRRYAGLGAAAGALLFWSNDFGIPTAGGLGILALGLASIEGQVKLATAAAFAAGALAASAMILVAATGGAPLALLEYNVLDVARDQWWYFGPWQDELRILDVSDLGKLLEPLMILQLAVWAVFLLFTIAKPRLERYLALYLGAVLFLGGLIPTVGGQFSGYFDEFHRWTLVATGLMVLSALHHHAHRWLGASRMRIIGALVAAVLSLASLAIGAREAHAYFSAAEDAAADARLIHVPELGGYLGEEWAGYVDEARADTGDTIEEYWSIWSAIRRVAPPFPVDATIHALGRQRSAFRAYLLSRSADKVITTRRTMTYWQPWLLSANWWFYEPLLRNYVPSDLSPRTVIWKRGAPRRWREVACSVDQDAGQERNGVVLEAPRAGLYEVEIAYAVSDAAGTREILMMKNNLNYAADAEGYLSVDPRGSKASFPVAVDAAGSVDVPARLHGPADAKGMVSIASCVARLVRLDHIDRDLLASVMSPSLLTGSDSRMAHPLTDEDWESGVARQRAGFLARSSKEAASLYGVGRKVRFANGERRRITKVETRDGFLDVFLEGSPLDGTEVGYPHPITVLP